MTALQATHHAHALWYRQGIGQAVCLRTPEGVKYVVGIEKDRYDLEVFGESTESFEDAFQRAEGK